MPKKDTLVNFKVDEEMADWLARECMALDETKSDVIRACILIGLPVVKEMPSLVRRMAFKDRKQQ